MKFYSFFKAEFKYQFQSNLAIAGYAIGIFLNLLVYYFTAKAFLPNVNIPNEFLSRGYFEFIIVGELCLMISQISLSESQESFFKLRDAGVLGQLYFSRLGLIKSLLNNYYSLVLLKVLFIIVSLILSVLFFDLSLDAQMLFRFLLLQILSSVFFLGFYFLSLSISALVGRRNHSLQHLINILTFFSGAYFPLEIFTSSLLKNILSHSPFALQVKLTRNFVYTGHRLHRSSW